MFEKGNKHGCREVLKNKVVVIRVTEREKESIKKAANGNISGYLLKLHTEK